MPSRLVRALLPFLIIAPWLHSQDGYWWTNNRNRNPTKGGWVSNGAYVEEAVFIAPSARVEGSATVTGRARVYGNAVVRGQATVEGEARVYGNAIVEGNAMIGDKAQVFDHAVIKGDAFIGGEARVGGYSRVSTGQITEGMHRPPQPAAEVEAARRAQQKAEFQRLVEEGRAKIIARVDAAIVQLNRGAKHTFKRGNTFTFSPNVRREGDRFVIDATERVYGPHGNRTMRIRATITRQEISSLTNIGKDRTAEYDKSPANYHRMEMFTKEQRFEITTSDSKGTRTHTSYSTWLCHDSKQALEEFRAAVEAWRKL